MSQITTSFQLTGPDTPPAIAPGTVVRVRAGGAHETVLGDLNAPSGIAFDKAGNLYVAVNSAFGPPDQGQVLRCAGVAAPAMPGLPNTGAGGGRQSPDGSLALAGALAVCGAGLLATRRRATRRRRQAGRQ